MQYPARIRPSRFAFSAGAVAAFGFLVWACAASGTSGGGFEEDSGRLDAFAACAGPKVSCGADCADLTSDANHCGACDKKCAAGEVCAQGVCASDCGVGSQKCPLGNQTACVSLLSDNLNCGTCGRKCESGYVCSAGKCGLTCTSGYSPCSGATPADAGVNDASTATDAADAASDASPSDAGTTKTAYCAKLTDDSRNCGACGNTCAIGKTCSSGLCCDNGQTVCGSACTNLGTDVFNCGTCGKVCPVGSPLCLNGTCTHFTTVGVQLNVPQTTATVGWTECFKQQYNVSAPLASIQAACTKPHIMMACRLAGQPNLQVMAQGPRADVFFNTGDGQTSKHEANGVAWYWSDNRSFGFAPAGLAVDRSSCDYIDSYAGSPQVGTGQGDKRMCTHTGGAATQNGWRCGRDNGLGAGWERILYHAD